MWTLKPVSMENISFYLVLHTVFYGYNYRKYFIYSFCWWLHFPEESIEFHLNLGIMTTRRPIPRLNTTNPKICCAHQLLLATNKWPWAKAQMHTILSITTRPLNFHVSLLLSVEIQINGFPDANCDLKWQSTSCVRLPLPTSASLGRPGWRIILR